MLDQDWSNCYGAVFQIYRQRGSGEIQVGDKIGLYYPTKDGHHWFSCYLDECNTSPCPGQPSDSHGFADEDGWTRCWGEVFQIYAYGKHVGQSIEVKDDIMLYYSQDRKWVSLFYETNANKHDCPTATSLPPTTNVYDMCWAEVFTLSKQDGTNDNSNTNNNGNSNTNGNTNSNTDGNTNGNTNGNANGNTNGGANSNNLPMERSGCIWSKCGAADCNGEEGRPYNWAQATCPEGRDTCDHGVRLWCCAEPSPYTMTYWIGTAPFCAASCEDCGSDKCVIESNACGDGSSCWSGGKTLCGTEKPKPKPKEAIIIGAVAGGIVAIVGAIGGLVAIICKAK